jgi:hypothetical protein
MKKKMMLDLDELVVESFATSGRRAARGTVHGNAISDTTCFQDFCTCPTGSGITCEVSCDGTCDAACPGTNTDGCSCDGTCNTCGCGATGISACIHPLSACVCTPGGTCIGQGC